LLFDILVIVKGVSIMSEQYALKKDKYTKARGGSSHFLLLSCGKCKAIVMLYQKDGPGALIRCYVDKIHATNHKVLQTMLEERKYSGIRCEECDTLLAVPTIYEPEQRDAFTLIRGQMHKEKSDGYFPPKKHN
jgi:ribosomal protein S27E